MIIGAMVKKLERWDYEKVKKLLRYLYPFRHTLSERDRRTDGHSFDSKDRAMLCVARL